MLSLFATEVVIIGAINVINIWQLNTGCDKLLDSISQNGGVFPDGGREPHGENEMPRRPIGGELPTDPETKYTTRYFTVKTDKNNSVTAIDTGHIAAVSSDAAVEYVGRALSKEMDGWIDNYKFRITETDGEKLFVFLDCRRQKETMYRFLLLSCSISFAGLVIVGILIAVFSKKAIRPAAESMQKQRQFITDAGHEIKTPLAIISANTEVLELHNGKDQWTESIRNQTRRLSELVKDLLELARMDEEIKAVFKRFDISGAVSDAAAPFETLAQTRGKLLETDIAGGISYIGDEGMIRRLVSILLDNAVKYADTDSRIEISLKKQSRNIKLRVFNKYADADKTDLSRLFDRFYRADESRSRQTGGYGIGLSVAKAITDTHGGRIDVYGVDGGLAFEAVLPIRSKR